MNSFPIFLSVVFVLRNRANDLDKILADAAAIISRVASDYEIVVVDNASDDESVLTLKKMTAEDAQPNLQIYALTKQVDIDTGFWVGLENALGDFVAVLDPIEDNIAFLPEMLTKAVEGADVVFAKNCQKNSQTLPYRFANSIFNIIYKRFNGINLADEAPQYRVLNKKVINFILQHPQPALTYRHLPATGGFAKANLVYSAPPKVSSTKDLGESIDRGIRLLVSTTRMPMRIVTSLSFFGALANLIYSVYVVIIGLIKVDVAPGWISLSLQQSGMFFLISLVFFVLGEYILHMASLSNEGPLYYVGQEFTSATMTRREKLNIEQVMPPIQDKSAADLRSIN